ncbi:MAG: BrnT family toxin [Pseudomonas sp.]
MEITYDPAKSARNVAERGLPFDLVNHFDFTTALVKVDNRKDYGETRWSAAGLIGARLHIVIFTETPNGIRVISFRKANKREVHEYEQTTQS